MSGPRLPSGPKADPGDVRTWNSDNIVMNLRWAERVSWEPGQPGYEWWSHFRQDLREEAQRRNLNV